MGNQDNGRCVFPLTRLQIGDLQSYLSHLNLFLAPKNKKFYILVDNRPWLEDLVSRPAHWWQFMVTKSRLSPFANTKGRKKMKENGELIESKSSASKLKKFRQWYSLIDAATFSKKRVLLPVKKLKKSLVLDNKLHRTLYGFIVFEAEWTDVRGINYINELQTDTSLAIEAKFMKKWEFDSIAQAARCISSWFPGTYYERFLLKEHLNSEIGEVFFDAHEDFPKANKTDDNEKIFNGNACYEEESPCSPSNSFSEYLQTSPPPNGPNKRRKVTKSISNGVEVDKYSEETLSESFGSPTHSHAGDLEVFVEGTEYRDVLLLFRFNDRDLPFKLKDIIMSDVRLLTLIESGLPSWVIFLQSYPGFCHIYRPWMCPLARALYVLVSVVTVLIGFYDLYKNVHVLKATLSHLFGPLFDWIETWEMVSRIKYLGTMLFLHNFQKAVQWFMMITRTIRSFLSILTQPIGVPFVEFLGVLLPFWNMFLQVAEGLCSVIWIVIESSCSLVENVFKFVLFPLWLILSVIWTIAISFIQPIFWILCEVLYAPIRMVVGLSSLLAFICTCMYSMILETWLIVSSIFQFASDAEATVNMHEVSMWRSLWNDIFSQIFRAIRTILNGFMAFFAACNRHRLSIYNHLQKFVQRLSHRDQRSRRLTAASHSGQTSGTQKLSDDKEESPHQTKYGRQR